MYIKTCKKMKLNKVLIVLFVGLFCMPAISLERRVSYDNGRWAEIPMNEKRGVVITDNPDDGVPYTGGIVSPGRKLYADLPDDRTHKYLKAKYRPIKPKPIETHNHPATNTSQNNMQKAMYQFIVGVKGVKDLDWAGYRMLGPKQEESMAQGIVRSSINVPSKIIADVVSPILSEKSEQKLRETTHVSYTDITEKDTKLSAIILGRILGGMLLFFIPASIARKHDRETGKHIVICGGIVSVLVAIFDAPVFSMIYIALFVFCMILASKTRE